MDILGTDVTLAGLKRGAEKFGTHVAASVVKRVSVRLNGFAPKEAEPYGRGMGGAETAQDSEAQNAGEKCPECSGPLTPVGSEQLYFDCAKCDKGFPKEQIKNAGGGATEKERTTGDLWDRADKAQREKMAKAVGISDETVATIYHLNWMALDSSLQRSLIKNEGEGGAPAAASPASGGVDSSALGYQSAQKTTTAKREDYCDACDRVKASCVCAKENAQDQSKCTGCGAKLVKEELARGEGLCTGCLSFDNAQAQSKCQACGYESPEKWDGKCESCGIQYKGYEDGTDLRKNSASEDVFTCDECGEREREGLKTIRQGKALCDECARMPKENASGKCASCGKKKPELGPDGNCASCEGMENASPVCSCDAGDGEKDPKEHDGRCAVYTSSFRKNASENDIEREWDSMGSKARAMLLEDLGVSANPDSFYRGLPQSVKMALKQYIGTLGTEAFGNRKNGKGEPCDAKVFTDKVNIEQLDGSLLPMHLCTKCCDQAKRDGVFEGLANSIKNKGLPDLKKWWDQADNSQRELLLEDAGVPGSHMMATVNFANLTREVKLKLESMRGTIVDNSLKNEKTIKCPCGEVSSNPADFSKVEGDKGICKRCAGERTNAGHLTPDSWELASLEERLQWLERAGQDINLATRRFIDLSLDVHKALQDAVDKPANRNLDEFLDHHANPATSPLEDRLNSAADFLCPDCDTPLRKNPNDSPEADEFKCIRCGREMERGEAIAKESRKNATEHTCNHNDAKSQESCPKCKEIDAELAKRDAEKKNANDGAKCPKCGDWGHLQGSLEGDTVRYDDDKHSWTVEVNTGKKTLLNAGPEGRMPKFTFKDVNGERHSIFAKDEAAAWQQLSDDFATPLADIKGMGIKLESTVKNAVTDLKKEWNALSGPTRAQVLRKYGTPDMTQWSSGPWEETTPEIKAAFGKAFKMENTLPDSVVGDEKEERYENAAESCSCGCPRDSHGPDASGASCRKCECGHFELKNVDVPESHLEEDKQDALEIARHVEGIEHEVDEILKKDDEVANVDPLGESKDPLYNTAGLGVARGASKYGSKA